MSRPAIEEKDRRLIQVNIRLTKEEASTIDEQAKASGLSPANWIRHKVFTGRFPVPKISSLNAAVYHELKKIGVNLNQATHKLNQGERPEGINKLLTELLSLLHRIINLLLHDSKSDQG